MTELTASNEHYIKAICEVSKGNEGARISDIAANREVSKASVCVAMKTLERKNLVKRDYNRKVLLTSEGKNFAAFIQDKYAIIRQFLMEILKIEERIAGIDACALEHVISIETFYSMLRLLKEKTKE